MQQVEFIKSNRGKTVLVVDGYEFYKKRENTTTIAWNCSQYQSANCRTQALTEGNRLKEIRGTHNHDIQLGKVKTRKVTNRIKEFSQFNTPAVSVASALLEVTEDYATQLALPTKSSLCKVAQRVRHNNDLVLLPNPTTRDFVVADEFASFLLFDSGRADHERILIFGDREMLRLLERSVF